MNKQFFRSATVLAALVAMLPGFTSICRAQYTNGIYAEFNTSMGSYTCRLEYTLAPKACASFIGLATGQRAWLERATGRVRTNAFHDGLLIHRVLLGLIIQGGSPDGLPDGDPGYVFVDEFTPSLRHDAFGALSMANSGRNSSGSSFFITVVPAAPYDDHYTMFGRLIGGSNVVYAINHVATDANDRPLTNVVVQSVNIRRVGAAAVAFDVNAQGLPIVTNLNLKIAKTGTNVSLTFSNRLYADTRWYASSDLAQWTQNFVGIENVSQPMNNVPVSFGSPKQFFRAAQVQYPSSTFAPRNVYNRTLTVTFTNGQTGTLVLNLTTGGGTHTYNGSPGIIYGFDYFQKPYNGILWPIALGGSFDNDLTMTITFDSATGGSFTGAVYPPPFYYPNTFFAYAVAGNFTLSP